MDAVDFDGASQGHLHIAVFASGGIVLDLLVGKTHVLLMLSACDLMAHEVVQILVLYGHVGRLEE